MSITGTTTLAAARAPARWRSRDYRETLAAILPAILAGYILFGFPLIYEFGNTQAKAVTEPDLFINKLVFPGLFLTALAMFLSVRPRFDFWRKPAIMAMIAYAALCGLSVFWALAPDVTWSKFLLLVLALGIQCLCVLTTGSLERCLKPIFWVVAAAMAINLLVVLALPAGPIGHQGIYSHKNLLGSYATLGLLFGLGGMASRRSMVRATGLFMVLAAAFILVESLSKTSLLLAIIVPVMGFGMFVARRCLAVALPIQFVVATAMILFIYHVLGSVYGFDIGTISTAVAGEPTFTGRTPLWEFALSRVAERPMLGHGYMSFWNIGVLSPAHSAEPGFIHETPHAHNGYIDTLLYLGWAGFAILAAIIVAVFGAVDRIVRQRPRFGFVVLCLACLPILHNLLESRWFAPLEATMVCFMLILFSSAVEGRPRRSDYEW